MRLRTWAGQHGGPKAVHDFGSGEDCRDFIESIWETSLVPLLRLDQDLEFIAVNPTCLKVTGISSNEFLGKDYIDHTPLEQKIRDKGKALLMIEGKERVYEILKVLEFQHKKLDLIMIVTRVPWDTQKEFQYFLCQLTFAELASNPHTEFQFLGLNAKEIKNLFGGIVATGIFVGAVLARYYGVIE